MTFHKLSWNTFYKDCLLLGEKIKNSKNKIDRIIAISRGGLVPARILSDCLHFFSGSVRVSKTNLEKDYKRSFLRRRGLLYDIIMSMINQYKISVQLSPLSLKRTSDYLKWFNDSKVNKYLLPNTPNTREKIINWINETIKNKSFLYFSICLPRQKLFIGHIGLKEIDLTKKQAEIGIVIGQKEYWRKGIGTLSFLKLLKKVKRLKLKKIIAKINQNNIASIKFFLKLGFKKSAKKEKDSVILVYHL